MELPPHMSDDIEQGRQWRSELGPNLLADFSNYSSGLLSYAENAADAAINQTVSNLPGPGLYAQGDWLMENSGLHGFPQPFENSNPLAVIQFGPAILSTPPHSHAIPLPEHLYCLDWSPPSIVTNRSPASALSVAPRVPSHNTTTATQLEPKTPRVLIPKKAPISKPRGKKRKLEEFVSGQDNLISKGPHKIIKRNPEGSMEGSFRVFGQIRSKFKEERRAGTARTRKLIACDECHRKKQRCDMRNPYEPCGRCLTLPPKLLQKPCVHAEIINLKLHRDGSTLDNKLDLWIKKQLATEKRLSLLSNEHNTPYEKPRKIYITQGLRKGPNVEVTVALFDYEEGDKTSYTWVDAEGKTRNTEMPPYFICDMEEAQRNIREYAQQSRRLYIEQYLKGKNSIIQKTFEAACRYVDNTGSLLVADALSFWTATRLTEEPWRICGDDLLGVEPYTEEGHPFFAVVPVTPIMDTQIDEIAIKTLLLPLKDKVLRALQSKIDQRKKEDWFEIFLTTFILLCNVEWILSDVIDYTTRHSIQPRPQGKPSLVQGYVHACKSLLSHFHSYNGAAPFEIDWKKASNTSDILPSTHITYIKSLQDQIASQEEKLKVLKDEPMYKNELYWCHQTFAGGWKGDLKVGLILDFTEEDFLTS